MEFTCSANERLDIAMSRALNTPRNQIEKFIKQEGVLVNEKIIKKPSFKVGEGDAVSYELVEAKFQNNFAPIDFDIDILYEDDDMLVINKPPFLTVHPAPSVKEATLVDWLKFKGISLSTLSGEQRHGIVHRIDKETSGALVVAKNNSAHLALSTQLEDKSMGRYYVALIDTPLKENIVVDLPIARNPKNRLKMTVIEDGREAKSAFCKIALSRDGKSELILAKLFSGRTHQIRVHLNSLSRHILGDSLYGFKSQNSKIPRVMLHAYMLYLKHPRTGKPLEIRAPFFDDFKLYLEKNFNKEELYEKIDSSDINLYFSPFGQWMSKKS
ncbi:MAG: RluA family pseudouridine synthase [Sulfurospirillaceae bacterium]|nr:RluA family pseudouridine synthase [Sulfurospirillaceae bacterium]